MEEIQLVFMNLENQKAFLKKHVNNTLLKIQLLLPVMLFKIVKIVLHLPIGQIPSLIVGLRPISLDGKYLSMDM